MFIGTATALITPFNSDHSIDYDSLKQLLRYQLKEGIDALVLLGTTGEAPTIEKEERTKLIEFAIELIDGKVPLIVGVGTNSFKTTERNLEEARRLNVDAALIVNPYYNKGTQKSLFEYYKTLSQSSDIPIILYNVPSRTGMNIAPETTVNLANECKNIVGIKEASADLSHISKLFSLKNDEFNVYSGNDDTCIPICSMGGKGVISVLSNIYPRQTVKMTRTVLNGNISEAFAIQKRFADMMKYLFMETNPIPVKYAASKLELCKNILRLPLISCEANTEKLIDNELLKLNGE